MLSGGLAGKGRAVMQPDLDRWAAVCNESTRKKGESEDCRNEQEIPAADMDNKNV